MKSAISMKNHEFNKVYKTKKSVANNLLILYTLKDDFNGINKLGICASKTVGNSIVRHRSCRLIREAYRHLEDRIKKDHYVVVVARSTIKNVKEQEVEKALYHLLKKSNMLIEENND
ncbi:MAG: ribonuclease P protein component [Clostridia bacterium]|nr:ribonuclease P protein component [Clostridia bacterium]